MSLTFENPLWLLVAIAAVPVFWTALRWFHAMSRIRAWSAAIFRSALIALAAAVLAGAASVRISDQLAVIAVVDISESVKEFATFEAPPGIGGGAARNGTARIGASVALREWIENAQQSREEGDLLGVVVFDGSSIALQTPTEGRRLDFTLDHRMAEGTNLEEAMRFASALFPPGAARRLVVISDGNQTEGDALAAAREIGAAGTKIDVVPIAYQVQREVIVEAVDVPPQAQSESTVTVRVVLNSTAPASGTLDLLYEGEALDLNGPATGTARRVQLNQGRNIELMNVTLRPGTIHRLEPVFTPDSPEMDLLPSNNRAEAFTVTPGKGTVLVVDGVSGGEEGGAGRTLSNALVRAGINTQTIKPEELPRDLLSLQQFDLIVLQNVAAEQVPRATHEVLADYVEELGGGLVMIGGPDSFGAGGWNGTALEPILPVQLDLPEQLIKPQAAIMIVLDSSGSMAQSVLGGSRSQQEIANEGAALAIETLDKTDLIGVIQFSSGYQFVVPLGRNTDAKASANRVRSIGSGGGTALYPAMRAGAGELRTADANVRHMIILSDGQSEGDPERGVEIARELRESGASVSTIAVGDGADVETLARIAAEGGGQFYRVIDPNVLPRVFIRDIRVVRRPLIRESLFTPVDLRAGSVLTQGIDSAWPPLGGLVLTQPKNDPKITYALATPEGEPLLAHWYVGRGQVAAFTSDAHRWARRWVDWPGYAQFWTQMVRTVSRPSTERDSLLTAEIIDDALRIRLDATDDQGRPLDLLSVPGTVYTPSGRRIDTKLNQVGPGTYEARLPANERGNYVIALSPMQGDRLLAPVIGGAAKPVGPEYRSLRSNIGVLRDIAEAAGGRMLEFDDPGNAKLFAREGVEPDRATSPLWRVLIVWCIAVFLLDVSTRRIAWDRFVSREALAQLQEQASEVLHRRGERAAQTAAALRKVVERQGEEIQSGGASGKRSGAAAAEEVARRQAEEREARQRDAMEARRRQLREQMLANLKSGGAGTSAKPAASQKQDEAEKPEDGSGTSGLLAAKRRAQARFKEEQGEES